MYMYLLTEQIMNGTVTMMIISTGVEAKTFEDAIVKVKTHSPKDFSHATILIDSEWEFKYVIRGGEYPCYGSLENKVLKVI